MASNNKIKTEIINVKSVLTKSNLPDADYVINPYIGCQHACIYCYADFMKRFTGHTEQDWGTFVDIKINSPETIINPKLDNKKILIGSVTYPYQQVESEYKITNKILLNLLPFQPNLEILTKSSLIIRDIELLKNFNNLKIGISLNTLDINISKVLEPFASSPNARLNTLNNIHSNGIKTYLFISPIFPGISDYKKIIDESKSYVDEFLFENLNIRANNRNRIFNFIKEYKPELVQLYKKIEENKEYWDALKKDITNYCIENNLKFKIYFNHGEK